MIPMDTPTPKPRSDLGVRTASGVVMMALVGLCFWLNGWPLMLLIAAIGVGVYWEFWQLVHKIALSLPARAAWMLFGLIYIGGACFALLVLSAPFFGAKGALMLIAAVICTDIGAYFAGRTFGGPKIAPAISPSKTWSGLLGGMACAGIGLAVLGEYLGYSDTGFAALFATGAFSAIVAQVGDFFESWMKRRAGVKDSGNLIPGHGGLFDRTDGLIAVAFCVCVVFIGQMAISAT